MNERIARLSGYSDGSNVWIKKASYQVKGVKGTLRISFHLRSTLGTATASTQIGRNGVQSIGTIRSVTEVAGQTTGLTFTEDISGWNDGDTLEIYLRISTNQSYHAELGKLVISRDDRVKKLS